jgi:hypothetical protein
LSELLYNACLFSEGLTHICHKIKSTSMIKTAPNKMPPGMCNQKKDGCTNSLSQTEVKSIIIDYLTNNQIFEGYLYLLLKPQIKIKRGKVSELTLLLD